jgi:hypothetical protein
MSATISAQKKTKRLHFHTIGGIPHLQVDYQGRNYKAQLITKEETL